MQIQWTDFVARVERPERGRALDEAVDDFEREVRRLRERRQVRG